MEPSSSVQNKSISQAFPISQLLPGLSGLLSKNEIQSLTAKKQPRPTVGRTRTVEKIVRPLTIAEMNADLVALHSPRRNVQVAPSTKRKGWNSSIKVDVKKVSHTANGQLKNNPVRKVLNFPPPKPKIVNPRVTMYQTETPKFPKPEYKVKKSLHVTAKTSVRISGIYNIPQTPIETVKKPTQFKRTTIFNKENLSYYGNVNKNLLPPPTPILKAQKILPTAKLVPDTPLSNSSWKSGSDASFIQKEKEINDIEAKINLITEEKMLENIAEISPPISTPFKEYRSVQEYFNNSSAMETSALYNDNTIMCFEKPSMVGNNDNDKREESVIVSLCDLFNKATVTNPEVKENTELFNLLEMETQAEQSIKMIDNGIHLLNNIKESHVKSLKNIKQLIAEKRNNEMEKFLKDNEKQLDVTLTSTPKKSPIISRPCSVIKSTKSPTYKIPKKNLCIRKKIICKSMPNVSCVTPTKDTEGKDVAWEGKGMNIYMQMKEKMNFLSTPMINRTVAVADTPSVTSHNLQKQLDKLYGS